MNEVKRVSAWMPKKELPVQVAFVLSCPGQEEMNANKVCAGKTGEIINLALEILIKKRKNLFHSKDRYDYPIINSCDIVHYKDMNGPDDKQTEPTEEELENSDNIAGFEKQMKESGATLLILCGFRAQHICKKLPKEKIRKPESCDKRKMRALKHYVSLQYVSLQTDVKTDVNTISVYHPSYLFKIAKGNKLEWAAEKLASYIDEGLNDLSL